MQTIAAFTGNFVEEPQLRWTPTASPSQRSASRSTTAPAAAPAAWGEATPTFHTVKVWGRRAENLVETATRGTTVMVNGLVETETWTDKNTGEARSKQIVVVSEYDGDIGVSLRSATAVMTPNTKRDHE